MSSLANRAEKINKLYKVAKKHYQPVLPPSNRSVLEHLVYASCLEDSTYEAADEVLARLLESYFDWNEVRVTTSMELAELMKGLHDPLAAANRVRKSLQGLFETRYSFDAEYLKKENLGKAIEQLGKLKGVSHFGIAAVAQLALGGHSIPIDKSLLRLLYTVGAISLEEMEQGKVPGLERTIPKNKGPEFSSLVHQMAVALTANPHDKLIRDIVLQVDSKAVERFPKRGGGRKKAEPEATKPSTPAHTKGAHKPAPEKGKKAAPPPATKVPAKKDLKSSKGKVPERKPAPVQDFPKKKSPTKSLAKKKPR
jgi:endonuclease-3